MKQPSIINWLLKGGDEIFSAITGLDGLGLQAAGGGGETSKQATVAPK